MRIFAFLFVTGIGWTVAVVVNNLVPDLHPATNILMGTMIGMAQMILIKIN